MAYRHFADGLDARADEMKVRMMRHNRLADLAYAGLERALTYHDSDSRDTQIRVASSVAIPTLKGIGEFAPDAAPALLLGQPPAEILARWAEATSSASSSEPLQLPPASDSDET